MATFPMYFIIMSLSMFACVLLHRHSTRLHTRTKHIARLENDICEKENFIPIKHYFSTTLASSMTLYMYE